MSEHAKPVPADSVPHGSKQILDWMREGEARFAGQLETLPDDELRADSALPDWSRAHVAAHVARNAEALCRLLFWARTGEERLMYPDMDSRNRDIEESALQEPQALRKDVRRASTQLDRDVASLPAQAWSARLRTPRGHEISASAVPWMRVREVWLHLVDLGTGVSVESWPGDLVDAVLDDVTSTMNAREDAPLSRMEATDRDRDWRLGAAADGDSTSQEVSGKAADLLAWLTGRSTGEGLATEGVLPEPPHWM